MSSIGTSLPSEHDIVYDVDEGELRDFLTQLDQGYIGLEKAKVIVRPLNDGVLYIKVDQDNWAGDAEQAWA